MRMLARRALCIEQSKTGPLYLLTLRVDEIFEVAEVARINRSRSNELIGYQRSEVRRHVDDILEYLNSDDVLFPNSIAQTAMGRIMPHCRWTEGFWDELSLQWNDLENTSRNQRLLANFLIRIYSSAGPS